jgi:FkbM family methyltransferase
LSISRLFERAFAYCARFEIAVQNLGFANALRVFFWIRHGSKLRSIYVSRLGQRIYFRSAADKGVISHLFYPGTRILDTPEHPVRVIVDAGANAGMETVRMRYFHPAAHIVSIEPDSGNYSVLRLNAGPETPNAETLQKGLWSSDTGLRILSGSTNEAFSVHPVGPGEQADLEAVTMNTILARVGGEIDLLKMDIEGAEFEVFSKNTEWIEHVKAFVFECPDRDHEGAAFQIFRTLAHLPFDTFVSGENVVLIRRDSGLDVVTTPYL